MVNYIFVIINPELHYHQHSDIMIAIIIQFYFQYFEIINTIIILFNFHLIFKLEIKRPAARKKNEIMRKKRI